ncbi:export membrane protein [Leptospira yanagawae serovar Saopaulo str. Sao Paulo = ATCC 700523]|uniref:Export membrane protein n=1 Tax=Leptospira yanagawae serovar Saopaulo str. Sao Paulo = ATCC 700523 TaxID=1249483 RepID=A0A5E8HAH5_9LEPT|nr:export membrane protein [Leptospira yanagawae serovar Saopaulo str. Sao Paulo = ATCC 700523]
MELKNGYSAIEVTNLINQKLKFVSLPSSVQWEFGGEQAESGNANQSLIAVAPIGMMILVSFLLFEFGSWKKVGVILLTVPLTLIGVVPGLLFSGKPFGFLSLLGIFALVGIVVNNGILLLDYIVKAITEGSSITEAIQYSISKRIRPILLTTLTTVAGLLPLTITDATLWPPFAWTMISGLLGSTFLTLFVVPSATFLLFRTKIQKIEQKKNPKLINKIFPFLFVLILFFPTMQNISADPMVLSWKEIVKLAEESPRVKLAWEEWKRKNLEKKN